MPRRSSCFWSVQIPPLRYQNTPTRPIRTGDCIHLEGIECLCTRPTVSALHSGTIGQDVWYRSNWWASFEFPARSTAHRLTTVAQCDPCRLELLFELCQPPRSCTYARSDAASGSQARSGVFLVGHSASRARGEPGSGESCRGCRPGHSDYTSADVGSVTMRSPAL